MLQAAKILVISRLLHKKLSQRTDAPPYLDILRNRLASLRRKLLARIDRRFKLLDSSESVLVEAMCAFSLATSSSATDVLRHFHYVRLSTVSELGKSGDDDKSIFKSLKLFVKTLRDCQIVVPTQLSRALEQLKATPLLQAPDLRSLMELNLDIHQRWLGDDINSFIPYIRHDDLHKTEANRLLKQWASNAFSIFLKSLREKIGSIVDPAVIAKVRQEMLELWFSNQRHSIGVDTSDVLEGIRGAFNDRLQNTIHQRCDSFSIVASTISSLLEHWETGVWDAYPQMWDNKIATMDPIFGGKTLMEALSVRAYGRNKPIQATAAAYARWYDDIRTLEDVIKNLREKRWVDDLDDIDDDDDILDNKQVLLSEDDPRLLQETLQSDVKRVLYDLEDLMHAHGDPQQANNSKDDHTSGHKACFLLRSWREITNHLPSSYPNLELESNFIESLLWRISKTVVRQPFLRCERRISKSLQHRQLQIRILWEGDPQLPVLPSPYAFRFLHDLVRSMATFGADVWTPQAVGILKMCARQELASIVRRVPQVGPKRVNGHSPTSDESNAPDPDTAEQNSELQSPSEQNGEARTDEPQESLEQAQIDKTNSNAPSEPEGPSEEVARDMRIQRLFDLLYLDHATRLKDATSNDGMDRIQFAMETNLELPSADLKRIRNAAETYWKRTELLFALLA